MGAGQAACFAPGEAIPRALLIASLGLAEGDDEAAMRAEDALGRLSALGLLETEEHGALLLHRLLAAFVKDKTDDLPGAREAVERAVEAEADRLIDAGYPAPLLAWQPHLRAVTEMAVEQGSDRARGLLLSLGRHLRMVADLAGAKQADERALEIDEARLGPDHPNVATDLSNLGVVLHDQGDLAGARQAHERALEIDEAHLGPDHPSVATNLSNLGVVLHDQGDLAGARQAHERALNIAEASLGPDHPNVAASLSNLGTVLKDQGDLAGAREALERALAIIQGPSDPND